MSTERAETLQDQAAGGQAAPDLGPRAVTYPYKPVSYTHLTLPTIYSV